jgi:AcrR family transcriptional regulator
MAERPTGSSERGRPLDREESATRARVIDAAVACILERGFYRATSNEIARRAGVTWGVIQHYFGTRERLMQAVLEDATRRFSEMVDSAEITGDTLDERLSAYLRALASYYGEPSYLASLQVVLNLTHDPATSHETIRTLLDSTERTTSRVTELARQVLGAEVAEPVLESLLFHACRGLAVSHLILATRPPQVARSETAGGRFDQHAPLLVDALARLVERTRSEGSPVATAATGRPVRPPRPPATGRGQLSIRSDSLGSP